MTIRISKQHLEAVVARMNRELPGMDYSISYAYGSPRIERNGGSVDVSPRLPRGQLYQWAHAFLDGVEAARSVAQEAAA